MKRSSGMLRFVLALLATIAIYIAASVTFLLYKLTRTVIGIAILLTSWPQGNVYDFLIVGNSYRNAMQRSPF